MLEIIGSSLRWTLIPVWIVVVSVGSFTRWLWTYIICIEFSTTSIASFETLWVHLLLFSRRSTLASSSVLACGQFIFQISDFLRSPFILHFVFVDEFVKFLVTVHIMSVVVIIVVTAWSVALSLLMMLFEGLMCFSDRSFGLDGSTPARGWCLSTPDSIVVLGTTLVWKLRSNRTILDSIGCLNWSIHLIPLSMGCCAQSLLQLSILTLQLRSNVFSLMHFSFKCLDALWKIDCFGDQVLFFVSQLVDLHQKLGFLFSCLVRSLMVHLQVFDLLL